MRRLGALWPALLFTLGAGFAGGYAGSAAYPLGWVALAAVLLTTLAAGGEIADPLRSGGGRWLLAAALVAVAASAAASDLPRAGRVGVVLLPAFLLLPAAVARLLGDAAARRRAVAAWGVAVAGLAAWSIVEAARHDGVRASAPVGDPDLLAVCLAMALPIAAIGWRVAGPWRAVAVASIALGAGALVWTRSLIGLLALAAAAWVASRPAGRGRDLLTGVALLALGLAVPRLEAVARGVDRPAAERRAALRGAWSGALERPMLGWGPGSAPWMLAGFVAPVPGAKPADEPSGAPLSTPVLLAFELGLPTAALSLALAVAFFRARLRAPAGADPALAVAGRATLAAGGVALVGGGWLPLPAMVVTLLLGAGFALAGERAAPPPGRRQGLLAAVYVAAAGVTLAPLAVAHADYESARRLGPSPRGAERLAAAVRRDPALPLYRARASWGDSAAAGGAAGDWRAMGEAAALARGVAPLWLRAAVLARDAGELGPARQAAARAMAFDPLAGAAPFLLHLAQSPDVDCAARALLAEPRLAAAAAWRGREDERRRAIARVGAWPGIDAAWRREFVRQALAAAPGDGPVVDLVLRFDDRETGASSLTLFRRTPWPAELARFALGRDAVRRVRLPRAGALASSAASAFPARRCAPH